MYGYTLRFTGGFIGYGTETTIIIGTVWASLMQNLKGQMSYQFKPIKRHRLEVKAEEVAILQQATVLNADKEIPFPVTISFTDHDGKMNSRY